MGGFLQGPPTFLLFGLFALYSRSNFAVSLLLFHHSWTVFLLILQLPHSAAVCSSILDSRIAGWVQVPL